MIATERSKTTWKLILEVDPNMEKSKERTKYDEDYTVVQEESRLSIIKLSNAEQTSSNEISVSGFQPLPSPSSLFSLLRLSGSERDDIESLCPLTPRDRVFSPGVNLQCELEENNTWDATSIEEVMIKYTSEEQVTAEKPLKPSKKESSRYPENKDSQQVNGVQMPFSIPPTSHLALRRKLKRQASCQLPDKTPEESESTAGSLTHHLLYPGPKSPKINACSSLPLESLRKSRESATRKTKQPSPDCKLLPRSPTVNRFRYPRTLRVPRRSTRDTLTRPMGGLSKYPQTPPAVKNNSSSRQQIIHQSGQRKVSRYHVGSSCSAPGGWGPMPQRPPTSPRSNAAKIGKLLRQRAVGQNGPCVLGKVLVGKTKDGRLFVLPAIPLEHLRNKGFTLLPDSSVKKDLERTSSAPHPPSGKSCLLPPLPQAQRKRTVSKTRSAPLPDASRKESASWPGPSSAEAGYRRKQGEKKNWGELTH